MMFESGKRSWCQILQRVKTRTGRCCGVSSVISASREGAAVIAHEWVCRWQSSTALITQEIYHRRMLHVSFRIGTKGQVVHDLAVLLHHVTSTM
jgi:hypothetical protein